MRMRDRAARLLLSEFTRRPPAKSEAATDGRFTAAPNNTRAPCAFTASSCAALVSASPGEPNR